MSGAMRAIISHTVFALIIQPELNSSNASLWLTAYRVVQDNFTQLQLSNSESVECNSIATFSLVQVSYPRKLGITIILQKRLDCALVASGLL